MGHWDVYTGPSTAHIFSQDHPIAVSDVDRTLNYCEYRDRNTHYQSLYIAKKYSRDIKNTQKRLFKRLKGENLIGKKNRGL